MGDSVQEWEWWYWTQFRNGNGIVGLSSGMRRYCWTQFRNEKVLLDSVQECEGIVGLSSGVEEETSQWPPKK